MARKKPTFYVFHGEDEFSIKSRVDDFRQQMGDDLNISEFDGTKSSPAEILAAARAIPFLADRRLVIVYGMLAFLGRRGASKALKEQLSALVAALPGLPETARLVFVEPQTLSNSHPVIKLIGEEPAGYAKEFNAPKNPSSWIIRQSATYGVEIEPRAANALAGVIADDLRKADNELFKLAAYVGPGGTITEREVSLLTPYVAEGNIFALVDALGQRDGKTAMSLLHHKLYIDEQDPMQLFGMIIRQFRLLIQAREIIDAGGNQHTVAEALGIHKFVAQKVSQQARGFTLAQLERIYHHLLELDIAVKGGFRSTQGQSIRGVDIFTALDLFVAGIAGG
ncbi:MAG: DNA polymerase III subunit delta [Chloroflexi bacterium]|nr:DNA polymerase III subunit delta [Chloroflexota bacterium]